MPSDMYFPEYSLIALTNGWKSLFQPLITKEIIEFLCLEMPKFLKECGIAHVKIRLCDPQSNDQVQKANKLMKETIELVQVGGVPFK